MTITALQQAKKDRNRINLFVDDEFYSGLDMNTLLEFQLYNGQKITTEELHKILTKDLTRYLTRKLQEYWYRKPHSPQEMNVKMDKLLENYSTLKILGPIVNQIRSQVMENLESNQMGEADFAQWYLEQRSRQKKYGIRKVVSDLIQKGIPAGNAKMYVDRYFAQDHQNIKTEILRKKFGVDDLKEIFDYKERSRAYRFLKSRGF